MADVNSFLQSMGLQSLKPSAKQVSQKDEKDPVKKFVKDALANPTGKFHPSRISAGKKKHADLMKTIGDKPVSAK